jgi:hypothetical protein
MFVSNSYRMNRRIFVFVIILLANLFSLTAFAQADDKEQADLKKKIEMGIRRLDMRIDKVDKDMKTATAQAKESSKEYKTKLEKSKASLQEDLKKLQSAAKSGWKEFKEDVEEHLNEAKESIKPVML